MDVTESSEPQAMQIESKAESLPEITNEQPLLNQMISSSTTESITTNNPLLVLPDTANISSTVISEQLPITNPIISATNEESVPPITSTIIPSLLKPTHKTKAMTTSTSSRKSTSTHTSEEKAKRKERQADDSDDDDDDEKVMESKSGEPIIFVPDMNELQILKASRENKSKGKLNNVWDDKFDLLIEYGRVHGTYNVPYRTICQLPDGTEVKLGEWLKDQRGEKKRGKLRPDREQRLQALVETGKLDWELYKLQSFDDNWNRNYELLLKYGAAHNNDCNIPENYIEKVEENGSIIRLGKWLRKQRRKKMDSKHEGGLRADRLERLQALVDEGKLSWAIATKRSSPEGGDGTGTPGTGTGVPGAPGSTTGGTPGDPSAAGASGTGSGAEGGGSGDEPASKKRKKNQKPMVLFTPDPARMKKLKSARTNVSTGPKDDEWDDRFDLMLEYERQHGTCNVPVKVFCQLPNGTEVKLGEWVGSQRQNKINGTLRQDRLDRLQALVDSGKLDWVAKVIVMDDDTWNKNFDLMLQYGEEHQGDCNVKQYIVCTLEDGTEVRLGRWLNHQRANKIYGTLRADRQARLQELVDAGKLKWAMREYHKVIRK